MTMKRKTTRQDKENNSKRRFYTRTIPFHPLHLGHHYIGTVGNIGGKPHLLIRTDAYPENSSPSGPTSYRMHLIFERIKKPHRRHLRHVLHGFRPLLAAGRPA